MLSQQHKANVMSLSREITDSDHTIRSKMVVANIEGEKKASEAVWQGNGYFGDINPDFSIHKKDFPKNTLIYINQAYLTVKDGDAMIYCDYIILGQIISLRNSPENLDEAIENDKTKTLVKMFVPIVLLFKASEA